MVVAHLVTGGDEIICMDDVYGGTGRYFRTVASQYIVPKFVDLTNTKLLREALTPKTKVR